MARTVPILPCASVDDVLAFYRVLGFEQRHRQVRPNPYAVVGLDDIELHFFGMAGFDPAESYSTCAVVVPDTFALYESFAARMREAYGKVLVAGIPRMTRPRRRKNAGMVSGFTVVDPGGNWIRIFRESADGEDATAEVGSEAVGSGKAASEDVSALARTFENAVVLGESKSDERQAARILDAALRRHAASAPARDRVEALVYRAELAVRLDDRPRAASLLAEVERVGLGEGERERLADALRNAAELRQALEAPEVSGEPERRSDASRTRGPR